MNNSLGLIFALIAMFGFGMGNVLGKIPSQKYPYQKTIFLRNIFTTITLLIILLFFLKSTDFNLQYILISFLLSVAGYFSLAFFYKALKGGKIGIVSPVANSSTIITVLLSVIFFHEHLNLIQSFAITFIIIGILFISLNIKDLKNSHLFSLSSGLPFALVTCLLWGFMFFFYKYPVSILGPALTALIIEIGSFITVTIHSKLASIKIFPISKKDLLIIALMAISASIGALCYNLGIKIADVSIVSAITNSCPLVAVVFGWIFYRERLTRQQYFAICLILLGIISLSFFKG